MEGKSAILYKFLLIGIIVLFIGLSVQPVIASTINGENNPPEKPTITGPSYVKPGVSYVYTFNSVDPDYIDDFVSHYIDWGDGTYCEWMDITPSGQDFVVEKTWEYANWFTIIKAKARDMQDAESDWSMKPLRVSISNGVSYHWFLECFPLLERLLCLMYDF